MNSLCDMKNRQLKKSETREEATERLSSIGLSKPTRKNTRPGLNNKDELTMQCSCGSVVEHCVSSAKVVGSIPREHMYWQKHV